MDMLPLRKGGGEQDKMLQRSDREKGGYVGREVWNIENDSVKIEYERLKHNHYQVKELRNTCTLADLSVCA